MNIDAEVAAIRTSVALCGSEPLVCLRVAGSDAHAALDAICPKELFIHDGQMLHTLLLDEAGEILADLYVCADDEDFLLLAEGLSAAELERYLAQHFPKGLEVRAESLAESHRLLSLNGPYAWELLSEVFSPEVIGLPFHGFYHGAGFLCFRAGKTGEYGYELLIERALESELVERIVERGAQFDLREVGLEALDTCALENWFFNVRAEGRARLSPLELQLQWRISYRKQYPGSASLAEQRARGPRRRAVLVACAEPLAPESVLHYGEQPIGEVIVGRRSPTRGDELGIAIIDLDFAMPGLGTYRMGDAEVRVLSAPAVRNRSLYVDPQRHNYRARDEQAFPAVAP